MYRCGVPRPRLNRRQKKIPLTSSEVPCVLPVLATAAEIARPLGVTSRTITAWAAAGTIPVALRHGKILRFHPPAVSAALGLTVLLAGAAGLHSLPASPAPITG